jgi:hypothetical protein
VNTITADESWYDWSYRHSPQWNASRDQAPTLPLKRNESKKAMFTVMFSGHSLLGLHDLPKGLKMNSQHFYDVVPEEARQAATAITKKSGIEKVMIHMDLCKGHNSAKITKRLEEFQVTRLPHPTYSPDTSPYHFWFFGWSKHVMHAELFHGPDRVRGFLFDL